MNNTTTCVFMFIAGAAVGAVATWVTLKTKYECIAQEEIDAVKEVYYKKKADLEQAYNENIENEYIIADNGYSASDFDGDPLPNEEEEEENDMSKPYVISPDEFGELDYETSGFDYYSNGVLVDEYGEVVDDPEERIGDALQHFGEYEEDSVFVRDDKLKIDYEILRDSRSYPEEG